MAVIVVPSIDLAVPPFLPINLFDKEKLKGYGQIRIFDFLAERYFSFWIEKNIKYKILPGIFFDINNNDNSNFI